MPWWNTHFYWGSFNPKNFMLFPLLVPAAIWALVWKGLALWRAARNGQKGWFVALLVINSLGILEIVYLLFLSQSRKKKT